jgi:hypothetical protein
MPKSNQNGVGNSDQAVKIAHEYIRHFDEVLGRVRLALRKANGDGNAMKMLAQVDRLEEQYRKAWQLRRAGWSVNRICDQLKNQSIARWFKGSIPRKLLNLDPKFRQKLERPISLPSQPSPELAFILGVFCGRSGIGGHYRGFEIHSRDIVLVERLARAFEKAVSLRGASRSEDYGGVKYHYFGISSNPLARYLVTATNQNTSVPLRELADRECRRAFLQGFFFSCGSAIRSEWHKISVVKSHNKKLLSEVAVILKREGVLALVRGDHRAELVIQDQNDLQRFRELELLVSPADIRGLEEICASRPKRRMFTVDEYAIAMKIIEENPSLQCGDLSSLIFERTAGRIAIDQSVLRQWRKGATPASVKRVQRLAPFELAMRTSPDGIKMEASYEQRVQRLHDVERLLPMLRELAWLKGQDEREFPLELPELDCYRGLFHRLNLPFSHAHEEAWHVAARNAIQKRIDKVHDPVAVLHALREIRQKQGDPATELPRNIASFADYQSLFDQFGVKLSKGHRHGWTNSITLKQELIGKIADTKSPSNVLELLKRLAQHGDEIVFALPSILPNLEKYRSLFQKLSVPFSDRNLCGWHEAVNSSLEVRDFAAIALGIHNLVRRKWDSVEMWIGELPASIGSRSSRTVDGLAGNKPVLQRDLIELITILGIEKAAPAMRYLVGLSIASESQVIIHLAETTPAVRTELAKLFEAKEDSHLDPDSATAHLYDLLPGIDITSVHRAKAEILRRLAAPQTSIEPVSITEGRVLDWLDHIPKYCPRLGMLTELAKKAQQAGLNPIWAVTMMKDVRAKRYE